MYVCLTIDSIQDLAKGILEWLDTLCSVLLMCTRQLQSPLFDFCQAQYNTITLATQALL